MKNITITAYQKNFYRLLATNEDICIVKGNGEIVGYFVRDLKPHGVRQLATNDDNEGKVGQNSDGVRQQAIKCTKCPKKDAAYSGTVWYEGEEMKVNVCQICYNSQPNKKSFKQLTN